MRMVWKHMRSKGDIQLIYRVYGRKKWERQQLPLCRDEVSKSSVGQVSITGRQ